MRLCTGLFYILVIFTCNVLDQVNALRRCIHCRSRGELGSCKDPFKMNETEIEKERGVESVPCASGWCGKIIESQNLNNEYGTATQRMCLQRAPDDGEERCANTLWNKKKVFMCFCSGDLCNRGATSVSHNLIVTSALAVILWVVF